MWLSFRIVSPYHKRRSNAGWHRSGKHRTIRELAVISGLLLVNCRNHPTGVLRACALSLVICYYLCVALTLYMFQVCLIPFVAWVWHPNDRCSPVSTWRHSSETERFDTGKRDTGRSNQWSDEYRSVACRCHEQVGIASPMRRLLPFWQLRRKPFEWFSPEMLTVNTPKIMVLRVMRWYMVNINSRQCCIA